MTAHAGVWFAIAFIAFGLICVVFGLHKFCLFLERKGLLYYRHGLDRGSAVGNALMELDRVTRPSVQHVVETQDDTALNSQSPIDGE